MGSNEIKRDPGSTAGEQQGLADLVDQLTAVLRGFSARLRAGEVTLEERRRYGDMLKFAAIIIWSVSPSATDRLLEMLFDDTEDAAGR